MLRTLGRSLPSLRSSKRKTQRLLSVEAFRDSRPWYHCIQDEQQQARVLSFRYEDYSQLSAKQLHERGRAWIRNDDSVRVQIERQNQKFTVRPFWVSVCVNDVKGISDLYISIVPVDTTSEQGFLAEAEPQVKFGDGYAFTQSDVSCGRWRNYFVALSGDLGSDWHDTLFPTGLFHENRYVREVRSFADLGLFLADPTKERIETHKANILALPYGPITKNFEYHLLERRWGHAALIQNRIRI